MGGQRRRGTYFPTALRQYAGGYIFGKREGETRRRNHFFITRLNHNASGAAIIFEADEWESWREHPLTQWFMDEYLAQKSAEAKQVFIDYAWGNKAIDPIFHAALFERASVFDQMRTLTFNDIEAN